jgi:hypothetical protein
VAGVEDCYKEVQVMNYSPVTEKWRVISTYKRSSTVMANGTEKEMRSWFHRFFCEWKLMPMKSMSLQQILPKGKWYTVEKITYQRFS